jgi:hypothetical protein
MLIEPGYFWYREGRDDRIRKVASEISLQMSKGQNVAIATTNSKFIPQFTMTAAYLMSHIAKIVHDDNEVRVVFINGSDTAYAFCKVMDIEKMVVKGRITDKFCPILLDGYSRKQKTYSLCLNPGSYGDEFTIVNALQTLRRR